MATPIHHQILHRARALIAEPSGWTRGTFARTSTGHPVSVRDPAATRFCAMGALLLAAYEMTGDLETANRLLDATMVILSPSKTLSVMNDYQGHAAVLGLFDETLETLAA